MGKQVIPPPNGGNGSGGEIVPVNLRTALEERYLAYALSTIMNRALPDVRDGLKPVHRRILYAMREMRLIPTGGYKKSAKVVGEVMGNFHPHGDQAIYDALVRLAQEFAVRYPLVDGQGNFGNVDGDNPAAMRYTEARMTAVAELLLHGIDEDAVDFRPTYDGEGQEPVVLPGAFPNLLANGSAGIAVGMATNIPPHNAAELCDAALHLIKHPNATLGKLMEFVPGPDFPTGGIIVSSRETLAETYKTGRGGIRVRARWETEDLGRGTWVAVVTEIPYQVQKSRLIEAIAGLIEKRKLPLVADVRDESAEDIRIVIEPKSRTVDPGADDGIAVPHERARGALLAQHERAVARARCRTCCRSATCCSNGSSTARSVLVRRSHFRLGKIAERLEVLGGYLIAYLNIDEVIRIIREEDDPKAVMMKRFKLSRRAGRGDPQHAAPGAAQARGDRDPHGVRRAEGGAEGPRGAAQVRGAAVEVRRLRDRGGEEGVRAGHAARASAAPASPTRRRSTSSEMQQAMIEREPVTVVLSEKGWIRALRGHLADLGTLTFKEGDRLKRAFHAHDDGQGAGALDRRKGLHAGGGEAARRARARRAGPPHARHGQGPGRGRDLPVRPERQAASSRRPAATASRVAESELVANTRKGKQVLNVAGADEAKICVPAEGDMVAVVGTNRKMIIFPIEQLPEMARGKGVRLQRYKDGGLSDARVFAKEEGLTWTDGAGRLHTRPVAELKDWLGDRAQAGRLAPQGFPKSNKFGEV